MLKIHQLESGGFFWSTIFSGALCNLRQHPLYSCYSVFRKKLFLCNNLVCLIESKKCWFWPGFKPWVPRLTEKCLKKTFDRDKRVLLLRRLTILVPLPCKSRMLPLHQEGNYWILLKGNRYVVTIMLKLFLSISIKHLKMVEFWISEIQESPLKWISSGILYFLIDLIMPE